MTRFIVGPDGTRYKVVPNELPDPQDYGWLESVMNDDMVYIQRLDTGEVMSLGPMYGRKDKPSYAQRKLELEGLRYPWRLVDSSGEELA